MDSVLYVMIAICAYAVYRIGKQIYLNYQCVDEEILRDFLYGKIKSSDPLRRQIISHLGYCEKCQETLHQITKGKPKPLEDHLIEDE